MTPFKPPRALNGIDRLKLLRLVVPNGSRDLRLLLRERFRLGQTAAAPACEGSRTFAKPGGREIRAILSSPLACEK
jgi:hypothetical protein